MKTTLIFALFTALTGAASPSLAETYQWKDSSGQTVISDSPPTGSTKATRTLGSAPPASLGTESSKATDKAAEAPKTIAEKNLEFKKRQQEAREQAEKAAKEQTAAAEKLENCKRAQDNLRALESDQAIANIDANGQRVIMDSSQRDQEINRIRRFVAETCK